MLFRGTIVKGPMRAGLIAGAMILAAAGITLTVIDPGTQKWSPIDPGERDSIRLGRQVYANHCAACHGVNLEGEPDWNRRLPDGRLPAPPHDASGHTWHHPDSVLLGIIREGMVPPYAPADYESNMPAFAGVLSEEEMLAVLAYIKSTWPPDIRDLQRQMDREDRKRR